MTQATPPTSYDELLRTFKVALGQTVEHGHLPSAALVFDLPVIDALGQVARSARGGSVSMEAIGDAAKAFARYALEHDQAPETEPPQTSVI